MKKIIFLLVGLMLLNINNLSAKEDEVKNGVQKTYYPNGVLWLELTYKNGKLEGKQKSYFENGNIQTEDEYKNDKRNGQYKGYSSNGKLYVEYTFIDDKKNGPFSYYYKSGAIREKGNFKDDLPEGVISFYEEEDGSIYMEIEFKKGTPISGKCGNGRKLSKKELINWWKNIADINCNS